MKNQMIFYAISAFIGVLAATQNFFLLFAFFCVYIVFLWKQKGYKAFRWSLVMFIFILFFIRTEIDEKNNITNFIGNESLFFIYVDDTAKVDGDQLTVTGKEKDSKERLMVKYKIKSEIEKNELLQSLSPGQLCMVTGTLKEASPSTNKNLFNYHTYLKRNNIHWIFQVDQLTQVDSQISSNILQTLKKVRFLGIRYIETHFPKESVPLAAALLFGTSDYFTSDLMDAYRELGIVHLLAISGLHITIIVTILYFLLLRVGMTREKSVLLLLILLPIYAILAGASPSVIRSVLMTMLLLIGKRWGELFPISTIDAISLTFLLYVFTIPNSIYHIGFQLSFLVTYTLLISSTFLLKRYTHPVTLLLSTSLLSTVCSAPLLLYYFFEFSLISFIVNLIYIPIFNLLLLPALLFLFVLHLLMGNILHPFLLLLNEIIFFTNTLTEKIAILPWNMIVLGRPSNVYSFLYTCGIYLFFMLWEKDKKGLKKVGLYLSLCALFGGQYLFNQFSPEGEITFIDVGQGDAIYIHLPYGRGDYLIDTGGDIQWNTLEDWQKKDRPYNVGRETIVPFLKSRGVTKLDKLIITHGDVDHAGGASAVLKDLKIEELILADREEITDLEKELAATAHRNGTKVRFVHDGDSWETAKEHFFILSPEEKSLMENNNASIVLYVHLGGMGWLFTGDLEEEGEKLLLKKYPNLSIDVLKVGHHGSKSSTSESFLNQLSPKISVISAGKNNRFQHPHKEVLERLEKMNIIVMRTDMSGAITYTYKEDKKRTGTFMVQIP